MRHFTCISFFLATQMLWVASMATEGSSDTVTVKLGGTSKMLFLVEDQKDLEDLDKYDINGMLKDLSQQLTQNDDTSDVVIIKDEGGEKYLKKWQKKFEYLFEITVVMQMI